MKMYGWWRHHATSYFMHFFLTKLVLSIDNGFT